MGISNFDYFSSFSSSAICASVPICKMLWIKWLSVSLLVQRICDGFFNSSYNCNKLVPLLQDSTVKQKLKENMRLHGESSTTARRHVARRKNLHSQIKPTVSILLLGGMDGLINLLIPLLQIVFRLTLGNDSIARIYAIELVIQPLKLVQLLCHPLVYGLYMTKIRRNIFNFELYYLIFGRRSKVIVLNQQWRQYM